jgi:hypothetical protein
MVDTPFIVTTAYSTVAGLPRAEWFLVIPGGKGMLYARRISLDHKTFPDARVKFDEELLLKEALDQAKLRLRSHVREKKEKLAPLLLAKPFETFASDHNHLVKLWMRGAYCGCLSEIRAKSECTALTDILIWIHGLPMLSANDL